MNITNCNCTIFRDNVQVRIMRKRLIRKTFDMIQEISESENKEVGISLS